MRQKKLNCFQLCGCTILAENNAPRAKFRLVENRFKQIQIISTYPFNYFAMTYVVCLKFEIYSLVNQEKATIAVVQYLSDASNLFIQHLWLGNNKVCYFSDHHIGTVSPFCLCKQALLISDYYFNDYFSINFKIAVCPATIDRLSFYDHLNRTMNFPMTYMPWDHRSFQELWK